MNPQTYEYLKEKIIKGIVVLIFREVILRSFAIVGQLILVRLISPELFGIFAILLFVINFFEILTDFGLSQALIQHQNRPSTSQINTIITIKVFLAVLSIIILIVIIPVIRVMYPQLEFLHTNMLLLLSITLIPKAIKNTLIALLDKELNFNTISKIDVSGITLYYLVAIILALNNILLWNFIIATLIKEFFELFLVMRLKPSNFGFSFNLKSLKSLLGFGSYLQVGNFIAFTEQSLIPIAGRSLSSYHLGLLQWSSSIANLTDAFFNNYGRVAFAGMSKIQDNRLKLEQVVNKSISIMNIFVYLFCVITLGFAGELIKYIFPLHWLSALPALYIFVGSLVFYGGSLTIAHVLLAIGKSKEVTIMTGFTIICEIILAFYLVSKIGFLGIAVAHFINYYLQFSGYILLAERNGFKINIRNLYVSKFLIMAFVFILVVLLNSIINNNIYTLFLRISIAVMAYIVCCALIMKEDMRNILSVIKIAVRK